MLIAFDGKKPIIKSSVLLGEGCQIIGDVTIEDNVSIWYNAILRADLSPIKVGKGSNIQDNATVHVERERPTIIGKNVTIGHNAIIHACTIEDNVLVGMGAIILNGACIRKNCLIGAGTLITENKDIPEGSLVLGSPGKVIRSLTSEEIEKITISGIRYQELAKKHIGEKK